MRSERLFGDIRLLALAVLLAAATKVFAQDDLDLEAVSASGDPLVEAFDGTLFFFSGIPGHIYNLASDEGMFQISTLVKEANNAKHTGLGKNGTYMQSVAFGSKEATVLVETFSDSSAKIMVTINGKALLMDASGISSRELTLKDGTNLSVTWNLFQQPHGTAVNITAESVSLLVYLVPPGLDNHDMWQPSYLNINLTLLHLPKNDLQGVIGDTFHYRSKDLPLEGAAATADSKLYDAPIESYVNDVYPIYPDFTYELPSFFAAPRYTFTHRFTHHMIKMRKEAATRKAALSLPVSAA